MVYEKSRRHLGALALQQQNSTKKNSSFWMGEGTWWQHLVHALHYWGYPGSITKKHQCVHDQ
jgi:hypothetical protein